MSLTNLQSNLVVGLDDKPLMLDDIQVGQHIKGLSGYNFVNKIEKTDAVRSAYIINGLTSAVTDETLFHTSEGWKAINPLLALQHQGEFAEAIGKLEVGDKITNSAGDFTEVTEIEKVEPFKATLLEIKLDGDHTFFLDGLLVHNKGGQSGGGTTITKNEPPAYLQPYLTDIASQAQAAQNQVKAVPDYNGALIAPTNANQTAGQNSQLQVANQINGIGNTSLNMANYQADQATNGGYRNAVAANWTPTAANTAGVIEATTQPVYQKLIEQTLPGQKSAAIQGGAYGGSRDGIMAGQAIGQFNQDAMNIGAKINYEDFARQQGELFADNQGTKALMPDIFKTEQAAALTTPGLIDAGINQNLLSGSIQQNIGNSQQLAEQDTLDAAYQKYLLQLQMPYAGLDQYANIVSGIPAGQTSTSTGPRQSSGMGALGGAASGAMAGSTFGPWGTAAGAVLGGLFG